MTVREKIVNLFLSVEDSYTDKILGYLSYIRFYDFPASTKYHLAFDGGLALHSLNVYNYFNKLCKECHVNIPQSSIVKTALLHDLCKTKQYEKKEGKWVFRKNAREGHSLLSLQLLGEIGYPLTPLESKIIQYHMGIYGTNEFSTKRPEYTLHEMENAISANHIVYLFQVADMVSTFYLEERENQERKGFIHFLKSLFKR